MPIVYVLTEATRGCTNFAALFAEKTVRQKVWNENARKLETYNSAGKVNHRAI